MTEIISILELLAYYFMVVCVGVVLISPVLIILDLLFTYVLPKINKEIPYIKRKLIYLWNGSTPKRKKRKKGRK